MPCAQAENAGHMTSAWPIPKVLLVFSPCMRLSLPREKEESAENWDEAKKPEQMH